jgi:hypothetical protein
VVWRNAEPNGFTRRSRDCIASSRPGIGNNRAPSRSNRAARHFKGGVKDDNQTNPTRLPSDNRNRHRGSAPGTLRQDRALGGQVKRGVLESLVPGANEATQQVIQDWGRVNNVEVVVDFLESGTTDANLYPTLEAEARERSGHDLVWLWDLDMTVFNKSLEPVDDLVEALESEYGPFDENAGYLALYDGTWRAVAAPCGSSSYPMVSRLDLWKQHAGVDL